MKPNLRVYGSEIIHLQRQRREQLEREANADSMAAMDMLGLVLLGIMVTACLLVAVML